MKTRLPAILLNYDFFSKPRNRIWIAEQGAEAVVVLQTIWIASSQENNCKLKKSQIAGIAFAVPLPLPKILAILSSAVAVGLLDEDANYYFNSQIVSDHKSFETKRKNYSEARKKREVTKGESSDDSGIIGGESRENLTEYEPEPESEGESVIGSKDRKAVFALPAKYNTDTIRRFVPMLQEKLGRVGRRFGEIEFEALVMQLGCDVTRVENALTFTCSLTEPRNVREPDEKSKGAPPPTPKKTNLDRIKEFAQEAQNDTRAGDEDHELDSFGVRREVRAISAPVKSVVRGDGTR